MKQWISLCASVFFLCSCVFSQSQGGRAQESTFIPVDNSALGRHFLQGFPVPEELWEIEMEMTSSYDEYRHSHSHARLLFRRYRFPDGHSVFVLQRQMVPSYTLISYSQGVFFPSYHTHVRFLLDRGEEKMVAGLYENMLQEWRKKYPKLARQPQREYKDLLFFFDSPVEGYFYFLAAPDGAILHKDFSEDGILPIDEVKSHYQWDEIGASPCSFAPNTFPALFHAIKVLKPLRRPPDTAEWTETDRTSVGAILEVVLQLLPSLSYAISGKSRHDVDITYRYEEDKGVITADVSRFADPALGEGFELKRYRRKQLLNLPGKDLKSDWVQLEAGEGETRILFTLHFRHSEVDGQSK